MATLKSHLETILLHAENDTLNDTTWFDASVGICGVLYNKLCDDNDHFDNPYSVYTQKLADAFRTWPDFSGNFNYPVPSSNKRKNASEYFLTTNDLWRANQLKYRIDLLKHIIGTL